MRSCHLLAVPRVSSMVTSDEITAIPEKNPNSTLYTSSCSTAVKLVWSNPNTKQQQQQLIMTKQHYYILTIRPGNCSFSGLKRFLTMLQQQQLCLLTLHSRPSDERVNCFSQATKKKIVVSQARLYPWISPRLPLNSNHRTTQILVTPPLH